jgi:hypothetical protein
LTTSFATGDLGCAAATARQMQLRGPRAAVLEVPGVGHAPALLDATQLAPVVEFLRR